MSNKNKVYILLDRSGSMISMWEEAISGINSYVKKLENVDVTLVTFDSDRKDGFNYDIVRKCNSDSWLSVSLKEIEPRGGTPLLDAAGRIIQTMFDSDADRAVLVVVTDGEENTSKKYTKEEVQMMTKKLTRSERYDIVFLGANFDKVADVASFNFNFNDGTRIMHTSIKGFASAMNATAIATANYFSTGNKAKAFYNEEDEKEANK